MLTITTLSAAEVAVLLVGLIVSLLVAFAAHRWLKHNGHYLTWIAHQVHGIEPLNRRNCYRSTRTNSFLSVAKVEAAERRTHHFVRWIVLPVLVAIPLVVTAAGIS